jgi:hypothetical protein
MNFAKLLAVTSLCMTSYMLQAQCPLNLADLLDGGTFTGPCVLNVGAAATITGNINYTGDLTLTGVTTLTITSDLNFAGGILAIQGGGNLIVGNGVQGSLTVLSGTVQVNGSLQVAANSSITTSAGTAVQVGTTITVNSGGTINNSGSISNSSGNTTISGTVNLFPGSTMDNFANLTVTTPGSVDIGGSLLARTVNVGTGATLNVQNSGAITTDGTADNLIEGNLTTTGALLFGGDLVVTSATGIVTMNGGSLTINRGGGDGDIEVTDNAHFTMNAGTLTIQDDLVTYMDGSNANPSTGTIVLNGSITIGDDIEITGASSSLTSSVAGTIITLADAYVDPNCLYGNGIFHFCSCIGNPSDADGVSAICASALPIELLEFSGSQSGNAIELSWVTATETNNDFFTIEKLLANDLFQEVLRIPGSGTTVIQKNYSAKDIKPSPGKNYYRLKQTDYDLKTSYSDLIKVMFQARSLQLQVFPNPAEGRDLQLAIRGAEPNSRVVVEIKNTIQTVHRREIQTDSEGIANVSLSLEGRSNGIYFISVASETQKIILR